MRFLKLTKLYKNKPTKKPTKHLRRYYKNTDSQKKRESVVGICPPPTRQIQPTAPLKKTKNKNKEYRLPGYRLEIWVPWGWSTAQEMFPTRGPFTQVRNHLLH